jgi:hypothetical protein
MTADGQYAVMGNHRGLQAITGKPVMSYEVDWDSTPDGEKEASLAYYGTSSPILPVWCLQCSHGETGLTRQLTY